MLLIFSIKEKVSKENGKKSVMNLNGLTSENLTSSESGGTEVNKYDNLSNLDYGYKLFGINDL